MCCPGYRGKEGAAVVDALALRDGASAAEAVAAAAARDVIEGKGGGFDARAALSRLERLYASGDDGEAVVPNLAPKSLNAFKSFKAASSRAELDAWIALLAGELADRAADDASVNDGRTATGLVLGHRGPLRDDHADHWRRGVEVTAMRTRRAPLPTATPHTSDKLRACAARLADAAEAEAALLPCTRIQISLVDFVDVRRGKASIAHFCGPPKRRQTKPPDPTPAPAPAPDAPQTRWTCDACTLVNEPAAAACGACGGAKPLSGDDWACRDCTLVNASSATACGACGAPSPRPAPAAKRRRAD